MVVFCVAGFNATLIFVELLWELIKQGNLINHNQDNPVVDSIFFRNLNSMFIFPASG